MEPDTMPHAKKVTVPRYVSIPRHTRGKGFDLYPRPFGAYPAGTLSQATSTDGDSHFFRWNPAMELDTVPHAKKVTVPRYVSIPRHTRGKGFDLYPRPFGAYPAGTLSQATSTDGDSHFFRWNPAM